LTDLWGFS